MHQIKMNYLIYYLNRSIHKLCMYKINLAQFIYTLKPLLQHDVHQYITHFSHNIQQTD